MKKILVSKPGGHDRLELVAAPEPVPGPGQARVAVRAAGVNYADTIVRQGLYEAAKGLYPITPGFEFSGVVDAVGPGAGPWKPGDRVLGITRFGGYAGSICADARRLWACPEGWSFEEAAAFPAVFLTAWYGLFESAKVVPGESALIHSAAGGVGCALLQLCRVVGVRSVGVVGSPAKASVASAMGAESVIVRSAEPLWKRARELAPGGYDTVFDANGVSTLRPGFDSLAPGGRLVVYGFAEILPRGGAWSPARMAWNYLRVPKFSPLEMTGANKGVLGFNVVYLFEKTELADASMRKMLGWVGDGRIRPLPVTAFPFERPAEAHRAIESGATTGKLVLSLS